MARGSARHFAGRSGARPEEDDRLEGRHRRRLTTALPGLLKKAGVKILQGWAFRDGKTVVVETETGEQVIRAEQIVIATGSVPVELPSCRFGGAVISSTEALALTEVPESWPLSAAAISGWSLARLRQAGFEGDRGGGAPRMLPLYDADLLTRPVVKRLGAWRRPS
jgi:dihydrolipoamide dehydrogenase